jgi:GDP-4-dehydro-6-deoxy-D-mannose reductase
VRAVVTGATGFVGPHLIDHLEACGDDVAELGDEHGRFDITDRAAVDAGFARTRPEVVYHLAARTEVAQSWHDPVGYMRVNIEGTQHVLDAARNAGVRRVLVIGSAEEYGRADAADIPLREETPLRPLSPYGATKIAASYLALQAWLGSGLETIRTRTFNHSGPKQRDAFFIPAIARRIADAETTGVTEITAGNLEPVRDIGDVRDVVRAYRLLMERGAPGEVYNVCTGIGVSMGQVTQHLLDLATRPMTVSVDPALYRPADVPVLVGDPSKLRAATGFTPEIPLTQTLAEALTAARVGRGEG